MGFSDWWADAKSRLMVWAYVHTPVGPWHHRRQLAARTRAGAPPHRTHCSEFIPWSGITVEPIPFLSDNYAYIVTDSATKRSIVVDPADAKSVAAVVAARKVTLVAALITHRHHDHAGGNDDLANLFPGIDIYGPTHDSTTGLTKSVPKIDGGVVDCGGNLRFAVIQVITCIFDLVRCARMHCTCRLHHAVSNSSRLMWFACLHHSHNFDVSTFAV